MRMNVLSLPPALFTYIWDFCGAKECMALFLTCRAFRAEMKQAMLYVGAQRTISHPCLSSVIPIFFSDRCHSVFLRCQVKGDGYGKKEFSVAVVSRNRQQKNREFDTVVWEKTMRSSSGRSVPFFISFRNDPSQEYLLRREATHVSSYMIALTRWQFMTTACTLGMKGAVRRCLEIGCIMSDAWKPEDHFIHCKESTFLQFMRSVFVCSLQCFSNAWPTQVHLYQMQIANILEQILEQKKPIDCVKRNPLSNEDSSHLILEPNSLNRIRDIRELHSSTCWLPLLTLKEKWERNRAL